MRIFKKIYNKKLHLRYSYEYQLQILFANCNLNPFFIRFLHLLNSISIDNKYSLIGMKSYMLINRELNCKANN